MSKSIQLKNKDDEKMYPHPYYPVGSIYLSVDDTNPSKWFGGSWELIAQGRTLVGVDTNDTNFNTVKKTGGSKTHTHTQSGTGSTALTENQIPAHAHTAYSGTGKASGMIRIVHAAGGTIAHNHVTGYSSAGYTDAGHGSTDWNGSSHYHDITVGATGGGGGHTHTNPETNATSSFQPYFTCYIWCRTA